MRDGDVILHFRQIYLANSPLRGVVTELERDGQQMAKDFAYTEEVRSKLLAQPPRRRNPQITLSTEYLATAEEIARPQVIIAGHRMVALLTN